MSGNHKAMPTAPATSDASTIDLHTARIVRVTVAVALSTGMLFFAYSAYAGTFLGGGSDQIFIGVACLIMILASCSVIEKIIQKKLASKAIPLHVE
jgi:hypothetical protein